MKLRDVRKRRVLTQQELAEKSGVSKSTIILFEQGKIQPHPSTIRKLAAALDVEPSSLVGSGPE